MEMKTPAALLTANSPPDLRCSTKTILYSTSPRCLVSVTLRLRPARVRRFSFRVSCSLENSDSKTALHDSAEHLEVWPDSLPGDGLLRIEVKSPSFLANLIPPPKLSFSDQVFFLLVVISCTTCAAFTGLVVAAVPTLFMCPDPLIRDWTALMGLPHSIELMAQQVLNEEAYLECDDAMQRAAISLSKLADTAREELPSTVAAIRLSGMEISDLILELSDMSEEITDGVKKYTQAVQAAEAGVLKIASIAHQQTMSMIQERANLPIISLQPVVSGAAKKTSRAVSKATKTILSIISRGQLNSAGEDDNPMNRIES